MSRAPTPTTREDGAVSQRKQLEKSLVRALESHKLSAAVDIEVLLQIAAIWMRLLDFTQETAVALMTKAFGDEVRLDKKRKSKCSK